MTKINIILSFDYELPLGGINKPFDECLFQPTENLLKLSQRQDFPVTLFADIFGYEKVGQHYPAEFAEPFRKQVQKAIKEGNDVQLHTHPHWLNTDVGDYEFFLSKDYSFESFSAQVTDDIITDAVLSLKKICSEVDNNYRCIAYRAGGYNFKPQDVVMASLYKNGIRIDSSIAKGYYFASGISKVDFRKTPNHMNWNLTGNSHGAYTIFEVPIATVPKSPFEVPTRFKMKKLKARAPENRGRMIHDDFQPSFRDKMRELFSARMLTVDNFTYETEYLLKILNYNVKKYGRDDAPIYMSLIGHPKSMGDYSLKLLEEFVNESRSIYGESINFVTYSDVYTKLYQNGYK